MHKPQEQAMRAIEAIGKWESITEIETTLNEISSAASLAIAEARDRQWVKDQNPADNALVLHSVRMILNREIGNGLFLGFSSEHGRLIPHLHDGEFFRGNVAHWQSEKRPNGVRINVWNKDHSKQVRKMYDGFDKAQKGLVFYGRKLNGDARQ
jgi:hypothetical protein